jgi:hypothetical protein
MLDRLIRLYPARWRARYGRELEQLVHDLHPSRPPLSLAVDLIKGALDAHLQERLAMPSTHRAAVKRAALVAVIVWLGLSTEIVLTNVVFPTRGDNDTIQVLASYLCVFAALVLVGRLAARTGASRNGQVLAGLVAGMMIGALTVATFAVVDNVWLDVVAQQQTKIDGLAHSGAASMREYINDGLIGPAVFLTLALGAFGAVLSLAGAHAGGEGPSPFTAPPADRTKS